MTNGVGAHVTRFPASDPSKAEKFGTGWSGSRLGIDSQGNVWVTNRFGSSIHGELRMADVILTQKTGGNFDERLALQTDLAIGPAGDEWVMNNWQDIDSCFGVPEEPPSTRCGGPSVVIFFGMAKPVRAPQIGPARAP